MKVWQNLFLDKSAVLERQNLGGPLTSEDGILISLLAMDAVLGPHNVSILN